MNKISYIIGFFVLAIVHLNALRISSSAELAKIDIAGEKIANKLCDKWNNGYSSFINTVTEKAYNKFENHLSNPAIAEKMMILLENDAELLNPANFKDHNLALIQSKFFRKLKERFLNSKIGKGLKRIGQKIGSKLKELYKAHGHKIKEMFKILVKGFAIPMAIKFARENMDKWKKAILKMTTHMKKNTREMVHRVIDKLFIQFHKRIEILAKKYSIDKAEQDKAAKALINKEKEVEKIEKAEDALKEKEA